MNETKLLEQVKGAASNAGLGVYDFTAEIVEDIADEIISSSYDNPKGWFEDLFYGGCESGHAHMFIRSIDCKNFYIEHIDSMEDFKEEMEYDLGETITNRKQLPHYTFMCWLIYEEVAYRIASQIWDGEF